MFWFVILLLAPIAIPCIPFYFFNRYLLEKTKPGKNISNFFIYLLLLLPAAFIYFIIFVYLVIWLLGLNK